ncbi:MAG: four-helix bundle copper-binding protein [Hyphomicrobium sp.]
MANSAPENDAPLTSSRAALSRRGLLEASIGTALAAGALTAPALAGAGADDHAGHGASTGGAAKHQALIDSALACVNRGEVCTAHCIELLAKGDTSIAECLRRVSAMLPMCRALSQFAALDAARLKDLARLCIDVCDDCEKECRRHETHHAVCKACAESCARCIKDCKALL